MDEYRNGKFSNMGMSKYPSQNNLPRVQNEDYNMAGAPIQQHQE